MASLAEIRAARRRRIIAIVELMIYEDLSQTAIARRLGVTRQAVSMVLAQGCPDFGPLGPVCKPALRPAWSYPDQQTLRIARQVRGEIQAALNAGGN